MRIGDLKKRLSLQKQVTTTGSLGNPVSNWVEVAKIWGDIEPLTAQQRIVAQEVHPDVSHRVTVRYRPDYADPFALVNMRIVYRGRIFSLNGALNMSERNVQCDLLANEGLNDG